MRNASWHGGRMWHTLNTLGMPTQLIIYPGEGHLFLDPKHQADRLDQTVGWFDKYLK
jgi:acylaminoacyl-peptidase